MIDLSFLRRLAFLPALTGLIACQQAQSAPHAAQSPRSAATTTQPLRSTATPARPANDNSAAHPALWAVRKGAATLYLFGTVHMLPKGTNWFTGPVKDAFERSDTLITEIADVSDPKALQPVVMKLAVDPDGPPLSQKIPAADRPGYMAYTVRLGIPYQALEKYYPWFVSMNLAVKQTAGRGLSAEAGAEKKLFATLGATKKQEALEQAAQQIEMLASVPESEQVQALVDLTKKQAETDSTLTDLMRAWSAGDADRLGRLLNCEIEKTPNMANILLYDRNARWAKTLEAKLAVPGTSFVAVGAGHLAGPRSVIAMLEADGYRVERVQ